MCYAEFENRILGLFFSARLSVMKYLEPITSEQGLTPMQTFILFSIKNMSPVKLGIICRRLGINQGNASTMCKKLEKAGFLTRRRSEEDERSVSVELTEYGTEALRRIRENLRRRFDGAAGFSPEKLNAIIEGFEAFNELIGAML